MIFLQLYQANMANLLHERSYGNKKYEMKIVDGGSNHRYM
jgi:hypothetical protein